MTQVVAVCIDDFALKKRQRYGTVMVDIETRRIVDLIESREMEDVSQWLSKYPNLRIVSRDGSTTYSAAITHAHPEAMQVSDRFHILKNLNERATQAFQKLFQGRISIPVTDRTQRIRYEMLIASTAGRVRMVKQLNQEGRSKEEIRLLVGISERLIKKYIDMREEDIPVEKQTSRGREHDDAVKKLLDRAARVRALREEGLSITEITQKTGFTSAIVKTYLSADFSPINAHYGTSREGKMQPYREEILRLRADGLKYREIHEVVKTKGYSGSLDSLRIYISKERRIRRDLQAAAGGAPVELIDKKWIIRLLYKPIDSIKGITSEQLAAIFTMYPKAELIFEVVNEFKELFKTKTPLALEPWMDKVHTLHCPELDAFVGGLKVDMDAVLNAITTDYSNGLVEGTINKIKTTKRIMYGRCRFSLLKNKCLLIDHLC